MKHFSAFFSSLSDTLGPKSQFGHLDIQGIMDPWCYTSEINAQQTVLCKKKKTLHVSLEGEPAKVINLPYLNLGNDMT